MAKPISLSFVQSCFSKLQAAVKEWELDESPESHAKYGAMTIKVVSERLRKEIESFLDATADLGREVASDARPIVLAVDTFALAYDEFSREVEISVSPARTDRLWTALNRIAEKANEKFVSTMPRSIASLIKDGVSCLQIANIYGWKLEDGSPDAYKVQEEHDKPGTHYDPATWINPAVRSRLATIERDWSMRPNKRAPKFDRPEEKPDPNWVPPSIKTMIAVGAPAEQIAQVHKISVDEAQDLLNAADDAKQASESASSSQLSGV